jgi:hypothetical protein
MAPARDDWQPIETAPPQTAVLVYRPGATLYRRYAGDRAARTAHGRHWWLSLPHGQPTHWMPLLDPPESAP